MTETKSTERVELGLVDPYFRQLGLSADGHWDPEPKMLGASNAPGAVQNIQGQLRAWREIGKTWGKTGNPHAGDEHPASPDKWARPTGREPSLLDMNELAAHWDTGRGFFVGGFVLIQLTQDGKGKPLDIQILRSSGNPSLDASAKVAITQAAAERIAPEHGLGLGGMNILSLWKMEARVVPGTCSFIPDPTGRSGEKRFIPSSVECGNSFDISSRGVEIHSPLETKVITRVELIAVYGGETAPVMQPQ